jgi:hypothetical protein
MITRIRGFALATAVASIFVGLSALTAAGLSGCATAPTAAQQVAVTVLVDAAVAQTVQHGTSDPKVMANRATEIVLIASQLKALDSGVVATLPLVTSALQPLLVKAALGPADLLAANVLVAALSEVINAQVKPDSPQTAAIQAVLQSVIDAANLYVPSAASS